jgi:hypothetical protein
MYMQPDLPLENGYVYMYLIISNDAELCKGTTEYCIRMNMQVYHDSKQELKIPKNNDHTGFMRVGIPMEYTANIIYYINPIRIHVSITLKIHDGNKDVSRYINWDCIMSILSGFNTTQLCFQNLEMRNTILQTNYKNFNSPTVPHMT